MCQNVCGLKVFTLLTTRRQDSQKFCLISQHVCMHHCACSVTFEGVHSHTHKTTKCFACLWKLASQSADYSQQPSDCVSALMCHKCSSSYSISDHCQNTDPSLSLSLSLSVCVCVWTCAHACVRTRGSFEPGHLLLSLDAHNHVDNYFGTLGCVRKVHI